MVKNLPNNAGDMGLIPGVRYLDPTFCNLRFHMPQQGSCMPQLRCSQINKYCGKKKVTYLFKRKQNKNVGPSAMPRVNVLVNLGIERRFRPRYPQWRSQGRR